MVFRVQSDGFRMHEVFRFTMLCGISVLLSSLDADVYVTLSIMMLFAEVVGGKTDPYSILNIILNFVNELKK